jgi:4-carboxymuconolactone decarboxylase
MPRLKPLEVSEAPPKAAEALGKMAQLNVFKVMAHGDGLLPAFSRLGGHLLSRTKLDPHLREIAIIRVGVLNKASYEVHQHMRIGRDLGMREELLAGIHEGPQAPGLTDIERQVIAITDDVVANVRASDATYDPLAKVLSSQEMVELVITVGFYMMVCRYLETFDVEIEAKPPEGKIDVGTPRS